MHYYYYYHHHYRKDFYVIILCCHGYYLVLSVYLHDIHPRSQIFPSQKCMFMKKYKMFYKEHNFYPILQTEHQNPDFFFCLSQAQNLLAHLIQLTHSQVGVKEIDLYLFQGYLHEVTLTNSTGVRILLGDFSFQTIIHYNTCTWLNSRSVMLGCSALVANQSRRKTIQSSNRLTGRELLETMTNYLLRKPQQQRLPY